MAYPVTLEYHFKTWRLDDFWSLPPLLALTCTHSHLSLHSRLLQGCRIIRPSPVKPACHQVVMAFCLILFRHAFPKSMWFLPEMLFTKKEKREKYISSQSYKEKKKKKTISALSVEPLKAIDFTLTLKNNPELFTLFQTKMATHVFSSKNNLLQMSMLRDIKWCKKSAMPLFSLTFAVYIPIIILLFLEWSLWREVMSYKSYTLHQAIWVFF